MKAYSTILTARECCFFDLPESSKNNWHVYRSNWRILHIDGFEPGYGSRQIHFEWSQKVGERTFDGTHVWVNAGEVKS